MKCVLYFTFLVGFFQYLQVHLHAVHLYLPHHSPYVDKQPDIFIKLSVGSVFHSLTLAVIHKITLLANSNVRPPVLEMVKNKDNN